MEKSKNNGPRMMTIAIIMDLYQSSNIHVFSIKLCLYPCFKLRLYVYNHTKNNTTVKMQEIVIIMQELLN